MIQWQMYNIGAAIVGRRADTKSIVAGGGADGVEQDGEIFDLVALGNPQSCKVIVTWDATLTDTKTVKHKFDVDHGAASNMSDAAQYDAGVAEATRILWTKGAQEKSTVWNKRHAF